MNNCAYWSVGKTLDLFAITKRMVCVCVCVCLLLNIEIDDAVLFVYDWGECYSAYFLCLISWLFFWIRNYLTPLIFAPLSEYWHSFPSHNRNLILRVEILLKCLSKEAGRNVHTGQSQNTLPPPPSPIFRCANMRVSSHRDNNMHVPSHGDNWDLLPGSSVFACHWTKTADMSKMP